MTDIYDPKGLIREAFAIEGISAPECRSIFLDWALGVPPHRVVRTEVEALLGHYQSTADASHPMLETLSAALQETDPPRRRGGRNARIA